MLAEEGALAEGFRGCLVLLGVHAPRLGLQRVDAVPAVHQVHEASAQVMAQVDELMLRVEADGGLAALQDVAQEQLQQVALALAGIAQDQDAGGGLVLGPPV